jgi:hypothetical protein
VQAGVLLDIFSKQFAVESILDSRKRNGEIEHLIKWAGYSESENSWEPEWNLKGCAFLLVRCPHSCALRSAQHLVQPAGQPPTWHPNMGYGYVWMLAYVRNLPFSSSEALARASFHQHSSGHTSQPYCIPPYHWLPPVHLSTCTARALAPTRSTSTGGKAAVFGRNPGSGLWGEVRRLLGVGGADGKNIVPAPNRCGCADWFHTEC